MKVSKYGVYDFINKPTDISVSIKIDKKIYTFYFDSNFHKNTFLKKLQSKIDEISSSLQGRFNLNIEANFLACITLYTKIMKTKGFVLKIESNKESHLFTCLKEFQKNYKIKI